MNKGLIITLPRYDEVTEYISQFSKEILKEAHLRGIPLKELRDKGCTRKEFEKVAKGLNYGLIVLNGHGSNTAIEGHKDQILVESGVNEEILRDKITYARSCDAGAQLGHDAMKLNIEGCFIGYELPFVFYHDAERETNPLKDNTAKLFLEPSNAIPISIMKGNVAKQAHENGRRLLLKNMRKALRQKTSDSLGFAEGLWNNYIGQVLLGNPNASLYNL